MSPDDEAFFDRIAHVVTTGLDAVDEFFVAHFKHQAYAVKIGILVVFVKLPVLLGLIYKFFFERIDISQKMRPLLESHSKTMAEDVRRIVDKRVGRLERFTRNYAQESLEYAMFFKCELVTRTTDVSTCTSLLRQHFNRPQCRDSETQTYQRQESEVMPRTTSQGSDSTHAVLESLGSALTNWLGPARARDPVVHTTQSWNHSLRN